jgi:hypothetical protein
MTSTVVLQGHGGSALDVAWALIGLSMVSEAATLVYWQRSHGGP